MTAREISKITGLSKPFIYNFCEHRGIKLKKREYAVGKSIFVPEVVEIKFEKQKWTRHKAVYDNKSSEQRIDELLNEGNIF
jgi:hypothetical protein